MRSLENFHTWAPYQAIKVLSVVDLFDTTTREKITALEPGSDNGFGIKESVVLHRLYNRISHDHFYCISGKEKDSAIRSSGYIPDDYSDAGRVLRTAKYGAAALHRLYNGSDHYYTADADERAIKLTQGYAVDNVPNAGFVFANPVAGTIPLYRSYSASAKDHFYTVDHKEHLLSFNIGYVDDGIAGHIFPSAEED
ncbi:hypothetical protein M408DRAFT_70389 [Serendipita vermifera MAFF 305830]|uniref:DUF5648 domain-containing protein n=1 Tax=Serendipita vermifera MAFF 305830 TaxID=933852 RepID=A0A0C2WPK6_SERVB|nr:hypothetical protein M408DRAFT_70389 [Serendipita vermifera MAFF 305830]